MHTLWRWWNGARLFAAILWRDSGLDDERGRRIRYDLRTTWGVVREAYGRGRWYK